VITVNGRFFAALFLALAGAAIAAIGVYSYASNQLTAREVLAGLIALVVAVVAGLWLRLHGRQS
jgi:hypothetical protein